MWWRSIFSSSSSRTVIESRRFFFRICCELRCRITAPKICKRSDKKELSKEFVIHEKKFDEKIDTFIFGVCLLIQIAGEWDERGGGNSKKKSWWYISRTHLHRVYYFQNSRLQVSFFNFHFCIKKFCCGRSHKRVLISVSGTESSWSLFKLLSAENKKEIKIPSHFTVLEHFSSREEEDWIHSPNLKWREYKKMLLSAQECSRTVLRSIHACMKNEEWESTVLVRLSFSFCSVQELFANSVLYRNALKFEKMVFSCLRINKNKFFPPLKMNLNEEKSFPS